MSACEKLQAFADGDLPAAERPAFHRHLAGCAGCQQALESALMLDALATTFTDEAGPGDEHPGSAAPATLPPSAR